MSIVELDDLHDCLATNVLDDQPVNPKPSPRPISQVLGAVQAPLKISQGQLDEQMSASSSPGVTFRSTPTDTSPKTPTMAKTPSSGKTSPRGGATPASNSGNSILQAFSRRQSGPSSSDAAFNSWNIRMQSTDNERFRDDTLLEPYPYERVKTSLSEIFATCANTANSSFDLTAFGSHRDTFAILGLRWRKFQNINLPENFCKRLLRYIDFDAYLALRLSCRSWSAALSQVRPPVFSSVYHLPVEILEEIYYYLSPADFNAARHACRAWLLASLDTRLLTHMLKRGGWSSAALADEAIVESRPQLAIMNSWPRSKRLATECQLRPEWTGNGLADRSRTKSTDKSILSLVAQTDFSELLSQSRRDSELDAGRLFTPSVCGQYLLVTVDSTVFVYMLNKKTLQSDRRDTHDVEAITSIVCPRRILAVSMDTSCGRFAVAALLEGRVGLVCDLSPRPQIPLSVWRNPSNTRFDISGDELEIEPPLPDESFAFRDQQGKMLLWGKTEMTFTDSPNAYSVCPSPVTVIPVEKGPRTVYRDVCSSDDPPRSIAICPQRRCIAFGNVAGIELHWTDALSGQDMSRWFALASASDYLYFVPRRHDTPSAKQLRLTSSAAHPSEKASLEARFAPELQEARENEMVWESMSNLGFNAYSSEPTKLDRYRTVPLSDGYHALFTDPDTSAVCLGCLPEAAAHDASFTRRVTFVRPENGAEASVPKCYAAAADMSWGVRTAVGYGDGSLWLFSVPGDVFFASRCDNRDAQLDWLEEYNASRLENGTGEVDWPVKIHGVLVAFVDGLEDVAIEASDGAVTLWAFSTDSLARKWRMSSGTTQKVRYSTVLKDGTVVDAVEEDGDWIMRDAQWIPSYASTPTGYDGTSSHPAWALGERVERRRPMEEEEDEGDRDSGYASDEGEPATSTNRENDDDDNMESLSQRFSRMRLRDSSDVEMRDAGFDEGYASRVPTPMDIDIDIPTAATDHSTVVPENAPPHDSQYDEEDDEGYHSDRESSSTTSSQWASSPAAIRIPSVNKRWSGESFEEHDWTPDYLGMGGDGGNCGDGEDGDEDEDLDLDLWDLAGADVEIVV